MKSNAPAYIFIFENTLTGSNVLITMYFKYNLFFRSILAHGFAVDDEGRKMSKSIGNVINPQDITHGLPNDKSNILGIDVLRYIFNDNVSIHYYYLHRDIVSR